MLIISGRKKKNKGGITISTSSVKGSSFRAVRGEMNVKVSIMALIALVEDMPAVPRQDQLDSLE